MNNINAQNSEAWISTDSAAKILNCTPGTISKMVKDGLLRGEKKKGKWIVSSEDVELFSNRNGKATDDQAIGENIIPIKVDAGMIEVSIALTGISTAIAALLPSVPQELELLKQITAILAGLLSIYSAYSALWLLARYSLNKTSRTGIPEIWELLQTFQLGPYWFMALGLTFWLLLSFMIVFIAVR